MEKNKTSKPITSTGAVVGLAILCCALWGSAVPGVRFGYQLWNITSKDTGSQLLFGGTRFFLAGLIVALVYAATHRAWKLPTKEQFTCIARLSLAQTVGQYLFYYMGLAHATGVNGSIIQGVGVFVAVLMSCVIYKLEDFTSKKIIGCVLGFAGLVVTSGAGAIDAGFSFMGEGLLIIATVLGAQGAILTRKFSQDMNPVMLCGWQFMIGGVVLALVGKTMGGQLVYNDPAQIGILMWLVMVSCVAYGVWSVLLRDNDVSRVLIYKFTNPIFGVIFSLMLLGSEGANLGMHTALGLVLICIGIIVVQKPSKAKAK